MKFHILTLFPEMVRNGLETSVIGRAIEKKLIELNLVNIRDFSQEKHGKVDDYTYGGGAGMLMQAQPVYDAWKSVCGSRDYNENSSEKKQVRTIYVTPQGTPFRQPMAQELAREDELVVLCGHYEGIDERGLEEIVTDYVSIGDYVLTGGELAAMVIVDAVARLVPGVLGNDTSADTESFHRDLLEYPQYSRPEVWHEKAVPEVLLSGNHKKISEWRLEQSIKRTQERRPDLYSRYQKYQSVIKRLSRHKRNHIHIIENLRRGKGVILYENGEDILVYDKQCELAQLTVGTLEKGTELLELIPECVEAFEISQEFMIAPIEQKFGMRVHMECVNACYTNREQMPVKHKDIRLLTMDELDYVMQHYEFSSLDYITERIQSGAMVGAWLDGELVGFAGEHEEGGLGLLYVHPDVRRKGIGESLEAYVVNRHLALGYTPYGQIVVGNDKSINLQEKHGLYLSEGHVWWMDFG